jgi:CRISPR/Cas system-associated exonuclease Cas4 (RecB family)
MQSFLKDSIYSIAARYNDKVEALAIVLPNKRAALTSKKYAEECFSKSLYNKAIFYNIEDFITDLSQLAKANQLSLCTTLYKILYSNNYYTHKFEAFYHWGCDLINDFDQVDKYLVNAKLLFSNLVDYKNLATDLQYLNEEQLGAIKNFWASFTGKKSKYQQDFINLWEALYDIYISYRKELLNNRATYSGLQYRSICDNIKQNNFTTHHENLYFIGFSSLSPAEEFIIKWFKTKKNTQVIWDVDAYYLYDINQEAGLHLRRYYTDKVLKDTFPETIPSQINCENKEINIIECNTESIQIESVINKLSSLKKNSPTYDSTVIVLLNEDLLLPLLDCLPPSNDYNISIGYPIYATPIYELVKGIFKLLSHFQDNILINIDSDKSFFENLLAHRYIEFISNKGLEHTKDDIITDFINKYNELIKNGRGISHFLAEYIDFTDQSLQKADYKFNFQETKSFTELKDLFSKLSTNPYLGKINKITANFINVFNSLAKKIHIPFEDNHNKAAIQIMGMLETRNLDFANVFIVSMNEGIYPKFHNENSLIPYSLRVGYNLPRFDIDNKSTYAYHFYRLLHKAKTVFITYNSVQNFNCTGEISSYLLQLIYESKIKINNTRANDTIILPKISPITISKNNKVKDDIEHFIKSSHLSPSMLNTYLFCKLKFYFQYIAKITFNEAVLSNKLLGTAFHKCMYKIYINLVNTTITASIISKKLLKTVDHFINETFKELNEQDDNISTIPDLALIIELVKKMVKQTLICDQQYSPFTLLQLESTQKHSLATKDGISINLSGNIDRIDLKEGVIRIVDYKTGRLQPKIYSIENLFYDTTTQSSVLQILFYSYLASVNMNFNSPASKIQPTLFDINAVFQSQPGYNNIFLQSTQQTLDDIKFYKNDIEEGIKGVIKEIRDINIPFDQTQDLQKCNKCPYINICQRH